MGALKPWHIVVLVVVLVLLFGAKRLPDAARSLGRSLRIIKAETKGLQDDDRDLAEKADAQAGTSRCRRTPGSQAAARRPVDPVPAAPPQPPVVDPVQRVRDN